MPMPSGPVSGETDEARPPFDERSPRAVHAVAGPALPRPPTVGCSPRALPGIGGRALVGVSAVGPVDPNCRRRGSLACGVREVGDAAWPPGRDGAAVPWEVEGRAPYAGRALRDPPVGVKLEGSVEGLLGVDARLCPMTPSTARPYVPVAPPRLLPGACDWLLSGGVGTTWPRGVTKPAWMGDRLRGVGPAAFGPGGFRLVVESGPPALAPTRGGCGETPWSRGEAGRPSCCAQLPGDGGMLPGPPLRAEAGCTKGPGVPCAGDAPPARSPSCACSAKSRLSFGT